MVVRERTTFLWTKGAQEFPLIGECEREGCGFHAAYRTEEAAQVALALHKCPYMSPAKIGLLVSRTLLELSWDDLDEVMDVLMDGNLDADQLQRFRGEARGMAKILARFMSPHLRTADDIAREAKKRWEARKAGEDYETPGLGHRRQEPPPGAPVRAAPGPAQPSRTSSPRTKASKISSLTDQERAAIKFAAESGMFTHKQLADTYGISEADVAQLAG